MQQYDDADDSAKKWSGRFYSRSVCPECNGARLNKQALHFFIGDKNISDLTRLDISDLLAWTDTAIDKLSPSRQIIANNMKK
ncbi:MAG: hypothetical protein K2N08_02655 [Muribaculaceae bacterium]|nr:hypothetical protein [Muribaculaceae bacterium]